MVLSIKSFMSLVAYIEVCTKEGETKGQSEEQRKSVVSFNFQVQYSSREH